VPAPEKLSIVVFSGAYDRVHYAFAMASAAAAIGKKATLFFTMGAVRALAAPLLDGSPGWTTLDACEDGVMPETRDAEYRAEGIGTMEALIEACADLDVAFLVCEMGLKAMGMAQGDLRGDVPLVEAGIVTFLEDMAPGGQTIVI